MTFQVEFATQPKVLNVEFDTALNISGGYDDGYNDGFSQGKSEGLTEGEEIGYGKGEAAGYENGYAEGDAKGYERGLTDGNANAMQDFVDGRGLAYLYYLCSNLTDDSIQWLADVNTSKFVSAKAMFEGCAKITNVPLFDTSLCSSFYHSFYGCSKLESIPNFSTGNGTNFSYMFDSCGELKSIPLLDTSKATTLSSMFRYCASLESIPLLNTSQATDFSYMFYACKKIKVLPAIDTSKGNLLEYLCHSCISLEEFLGFNTRNATYFNGMFYSCENLVSVELDMRNATSATSIFTGNESLTNLVLKNIKTNVQIGKGSNEYNAWGTLLTVDSLVNTCYELRDTGSQKTLTVGSANLTKLANVYVREIPITDAMREADDLIDEKLPFEVCDSTADGATLITDYVLLKNWKLA